MLSSPAPFPYVGSQGFERLTGRPLTVIQLRGDGRVLTRRDDVHPHPDAAHGNFTLALADIFRTPELACQGDRRKSAAAKLRSRR